MLTSSACCSFSCLLGASPVIFTCLQSVKGPVDTSSEILQQFRNLLSINAGQHSQLSFWMLFTICSGGVLNFVRACSSLLASVYISGLSPIAAIVRGIRVPVVKEFFIFFFSSLSDRQSIQICLGYFITVGTYLFDLQSGLISAYIIKTMYFGRYTSCSIC